MNHLGGGVDDEHVAMKKEVIGDPQRCDLSRLFIVCGRDRKVDELRALFSTCGPIKHLHVALDRSKKSRGFAFLQYEDPGDAIAAIEKLDHMKLHDGHILKVTVAKERPVGGNGKLKRNQHARQDVDEKTEAGLGRDDDGIETSLPGKRQRSSPCAGALGLSRVMPAFLLKTHRLEGVQTETTKLKSRRTASELSAEVCDRKSMETDQLRVEQVVRAMLLAVEQDEVQLKASSDLFVVYEHMIATLDRVSKQEEGENLCVVSSRTKQVPDEETCTDSLASSIRSVSLVSTPMTKALGITTHSDGVMPLRRSKHQLRRRRQSLDGSGSSTEDALDDSSIRRKRSNTTTSPPLTLRAQIRATPQSVSPSKKLSKLSSPKKLSNQSDIEVVCNASKAAKVASKKCKRESSDHESEEPYRLAKQQATEERREHENFILDHVDKKYSKDRGSTLELKSEHLEPLARTKLFFSSTYKFTKQEVETMFAVYGDFESATLVRSFGRIKTMAYICYRKPCTAAFVVKSFREESLPRDKSPQQSEFMTLSFAHDTEELELPQQETSSQCHTERALDCSSNFPHSNKPVSSVLSDVPSAGKDRLWVLLLYDRFLATHFLSSVVSSLAGMEFMDIKVVKSTGEAQGVAFVKFDCDASATQAALQLHQMELPLGSGKFLQAIVILAPSLFSTTHGSNSTSFHESLRLDHTADERVVTGSSDDVDLRAVEARFAHLMRSTEHPYTREGTYCYQGHLPYFYTYSGLSPPAGGMPGSQHSSMAAGVYPHSGDFYADLSTGLEYHPMQLVAYPSPPPPQFQPYTNFGPGNYEQYHGFGGSAPQDCPGVRRSFAKSANAESIAEFSNPTQTLEAQHKVDGAACGSPKLQVANATLARQRGSVGGGKAHSGSGRRKRQRVDPRTRK